MTAPDQATASEPTESELREQSGDLHAARRARLGERLGEDGVAIFAANPVRNRSNDTFYAYRPNSDLWYLTGFEEPEALAVVLPGHPEHPFVLFLRDRDLGVEIWDGERVGVERAREHVGADLAFPIHELEERLPRLLAGRDRLVYGLGRDEAMDTRVIRALKGAQRLTSRGRKGPRVVMEPDGFLHEMRLVKTPEEIHALRAAVAVSAEGHLRGMKMTHPGMTEFELQAEIEYVFHKNGARSPGYPSIVGAGPNACVLHYIENRATLMEGQLVLVDAGAEVDYYTGDITRTWPVSGRFDGYQREVYDLVLRAQMDVIRLVRPGVEWKELHKAAVQTITEGLVDMGVVDGPVDKAIEDKTFRKVFMHGTGHWLGIDVHDVGLYTDADEGSRTLEPGMVFTIEPGVYFHPEQEDLPSHLVGIGVRIEDNVLVTEDGCEVLSAGVPKEPEEIEDVVGTGV